MWMNIMPTDLLNVHSSIRLWKRLLIILSLVELYLPFYEPSSKILILPTWRNKNLSKLLLYIKSFLPAFISHITYYIHYWVVPNQWMCVLLRSIVGRPYIDYNVFRYVLYMCVVMYYCITSSLGYYFVYASFLASVHRI